MSLYFVEFFYVTLSLLKQAKDFFFSLKNKILNWVEKNIVNYSQAGTQKQNRLRKKNQQTISKYFREETRLCQWCKKLILLNFLPPVIRLFRAFV